jgi:dTDP-glucose 4,6-dehydratase
VEVGVNGAAESHNSIAVLDPSRFFRTNVQRTQSLLESCHRVSVQRFHHISTCEVYGDLALDVTEAFTEETRPIDLAGQRRPPRRPRAR